MFTKEDIVKNGVNAEKYLAKYPYSVMHEKDNHKMTATIGKLAENWYIDIKSTITDDILKEMMDEVEKDISEIRKNGTY